MWVKPRSNDWWDRVVLTQFTDEDWRENFRMTRASFVTLVSMMAPFISPKPNCVRPPVPLDKRVAIALYKMGSCAEYRVVANQFGIHKSTVKKCVYLFCSALVKNYLGELVCLPSADEAAAIAGRFEDMCHIPQIFGSIDGTHIPIQPPAKGYRDFINRKMWASYNMQAVVDDRGL